MAPVNEQPGPDAVSGKRTPAGSESRSSLKSAKKKRNWCAAPHSMRMVITRALSAPPLQPAAAPLSLQTTSSYLALQTGFS